MTPTGVAIGFFLVAWLCLTASLVIQHLTDGDGKTAIVWAFVPTILILVTSYASTVTPAVTGDAVSLMVGGGLFILAGVNLSKAIRRWHRHRGRGGN